MPTLAGKKNQCKGALFRKMAASSQQPVAGEKLTGANDDLFMISGRRAAA